MDHIEILVAAHVRDLAVQLRGVRWAKASSDAEFDGATKESRDKGNEFKAAWHIDNPVAGYVPEAYALIRDVALQIQSLA